MSQIAKVDSEQALAKVILEGDLSKLTPSEKVIHYKRVCESCGLNPLTQPFSFIRFQGREVLYAGKNCTEQLRDINGISLEIIARDKFDDLYVVTAKATNKEGRSDSSTGAVNLKGLSGDALANAVMKAETKAKRRVTLSIAGLGFLDESEADSIPNAQLLSVDMSTGEIIGSKAAKQPIAHVVNNRAYMDEELLTDFLDAFIQIYSDQDMVSAVDFWRSLDEAAKKFVWNKMTPQQQQWLRGLLDSITKKE